MQAFHKFLASCLLFLSKHYVYCGPRFSNLTKKVIQHGKMPVKKRSSKNKSENLSIQLYYEFMFLHLIFISDLAIFLHVHSPLVQSLAAIRPISSQLFAAYPQPPLASITPGVISSTYGAFLSWVCQKIFALILLILQYIGNTGQVSHCRLLILIYEMVLPLSQ